MPARSATATGPVLAYVALVALATLSIALAKTVRIPVWDVVMSLSVAALKAGVVLWIFMHLSEQPFQTRLALGVALALLLTLVALTAADVATRQLSPAAPQPTAGQSFYRPQAAP